jgi:hypothetical protein
MPVDSLCLEQLCEFAHQDLLKVMANAQKQMLQVCACLFVNGWPGSLLVKAAELNRAAVGRL